MQTIGHGDTGQQQQQQQQQPVLKCPLDLALQVNLGDDMSLSSHSPVSSISSPSNKSDIAHQAEFLGSLKTTSGVTVAELGEHSSVMVVFLRHFGCPACRKTISNLNILYPTFKKLNLQLVFVHQGPQEIAYETFKKFAPDLELYDVIDESREYYRMAQLHMASNVVLQLLSPRLLKRLVREAKMYGMAVPPGRSNGTQFGGVFVYHRTENNEHILQSSFRHSTSIDYPDYASLAVIPQHVDAAERTSIEDIEYDLDEELAKRKKRQGRALKESRAGKKPPTLLPCLFPCLSVNNGTVHDNNTDDGELHGDKYPKNHSHNNSCTVTWSLDEVLENSKLRKYFKAFCVKEFAPENILFWEHLHVIIRSIRKHVPEAANLGDDCQVLCSQVPLKVLKKHEQTIRKIVDEFLTNGGINELNVDPRHRKHAFEALQEVLTLEDGSEERMVTLSALSYLLGETKRNMTDSFFRFLDSKDARLAAAS